MINLDYLHDKTFAKKIFAEKFNFVHEKLGFQVLENATILPFRATVNGQRSKDGWGFGGIVDCNGTYLRRSFVNSGAGESYTPPPNEIHYQHETVIYLAMFFNVWGHSITDNLCRLWFLHSEEFKSQFKNCPLVYIIKENGANGLNTKFWKNFSRLLEILGVDFDKMRLITQPTKFDKIILPEESFHGPQSRIAPKEYRETIERVRYFALKNRTPTPNKKIYYFHGRAQIGEERLAAYFKSKGYQIVSPEKLSLDEQLNLLINCESFASTLGSISHNSIFLRDNTETIYIPRAQNIFTSFQRKIDNIINMNVYYVDSTTSLFSNGFYDFCYIISESLKRFFGDKFEGYEEEDFKIFLQYVKNSLSKSIGFNAWIRGSYNNPTFTDFLEQLRRHKDLIASCDMPQDWEKKLS